MTIPYGVTNIGVAAFRKSSVCNLTIPDSVVRIGYPVSAVGAHLGGATESLTYHIKQHNINQEEQMKLEPIVVSLLDTDLYKFNMDQVIFHKHTDLCGECRDENRVA